MNFDYYLNMKDLSKIFEDVFDVDTETQSDSVRDKFKDSVLNDTEIYPGVVVQSLDTEHTHEIRLKVVKNPTIPANSFFTEVRLLDINTVVFHDSVVLQFDKDIYLGDLALSGGRNQQSKITLEISKPLTITDLHIGHCDGLGIINSDKLKINGGSIDCLTMSLMNSEKMPTLKNVKIGITNEIRVMPEAYGAPVLGSGWKGALKKAWKHDFSGLEKLGFNSKNLGNFFTVCYVKAGALRGDINFIYDKDEKGREWHYYESNS